MSDDRNDRDSKPAIAPRGPIAEIVQPFVDLAHAPRALWGINLSYFIEGMVYFGMVQYLVMYFNKYVGLDDVHAGWMVMVQTFGITFSQFLFGGLADRWGVRVALFASIALMLLGRAVLAGGGSVGLQPGWLSLLHLVSMLGILFIVLGYGMYQPVVYSATRQFTTGKTATMAYAMLYAVMNLGGWLPTWFSPIRRAFGIVGAFWVFVGFTLLTLLVTMALLSRRTVERAVAEARAAAATEAPGEKEEKKPEAKTVAVPFSFWAWLRSHPLADGKFAYFIFSLIPAQTLFAHNWLTLPVYVERAYRGTWIGRNFEAATNFNPLMIFVLTPLVAAISSKAKVYNMMIVGTAVMAAPTFLLALAPSFWTLLGYLVLMTIGEAMWQPRFLQYAAEIAPEGRTGQYMGVAQIPWFMTKFITGLYSGWFLAHYCPDKGPMHSERMWLIYGLIAVCTTVLLSLAKGWLGKDFKTKS